MLVFSHDQNTSRCSHTRDQRGPAMPSHQPTALDAPIGLVIHAARRYDLRVWWMTRAGRGVPRGAARHRRGEGGRGHARRRLRNRLPRDPGGAASRHARIRGRRRPIARDGGARDGQGPSSPRRRDLPRGHRPGAAVRGRALRCRHLHACAAPAAGRRAPRGVRRVPPGAQAPRPPAARRHRGSSGRPGHDAREAGEARGPTCSIWSRSGRGSATSGSRKSNPATCGGSPWASSGSGTWSPRLPARIDR